MESKNLIVSFSVFIYEPPFFQIGGSFAMRYNGVVVAYFLILLYIIFVFALDSRWVPTSLELRGKSEHSPSPVLSFGIF